MYTTLYSFTAAGAFPAGRFLRFFIGIRSPEKFILGKAVRHELDSDRQALSIRSARKDDTRKSGKIGRNGVNIAQIHFQRIGKRRPEKRCRIRCCRS